MKELFVFDPSNACTDMYSLTSALKYVLFLEFAELSSGWAMMWERSCGLHEDLYCSFFSDILLFIVVTIYLNMSDN